MFVVTSTLQNVTKTRNLNVISNDYISTTAGKIWEAISAKNYDSSITKARTLLEEVFHHVIEKKNKTPVAKGNFPKLYNQVKQLYNLQQKQGLDNSTNELFSGLEKALSAIAVMRNINSDSHGVGKRRVEIPEHYAVLCVNAALTMAEFLLAVSESPNA